MLAYDKLKPTEILEGLNTRWVGRRVNYFETIDSTSLEAKRAIMNGSCKQGEIFVAEQQTVGRGRLGRKWISHRGDAILMSLVIPTMMAPMNIFKVTLLCGLAVCKAINRFTQLDAKIKWPNDIVVNNKKVCGILCELIGDIDSEKHIIIGMGINVNDVDFPIEIANIATSLRIEEGKIFDRKELLQVVLKELEFYLDDFISENSINDSLNEYRQNCITLNKQVKIIKEGVEIVGRAIDINDNGELIMEFDGELVLVNSGIVSVRGLCDYV